MTDFVNTWNSDSFLTYPVGPLGLIAMRGTEELGEKVNQWLLKWRSHTEEVTVPGDMQTVPGPEQSGLSDQGVLPALRQRRRQGHGLRKPSADTTSIFFDRRGSLQQHLSRCTVTEVPMSPDDHFHGSQAHHRAPSAARAKRINVIMPMPLRGPTAPPLLPGKSGLRYGASGAGSVMGVSNIITFDAHDPRSSERRCPTDLRL